MLTGQGRFMSGKATVLMNGPLISTAWGSTCSLWPLLTTSSHYHHSRNKPVASGGKEGNWQMAVCMNYSSGCFYWGIYLKKHRNYWVLSTSQNPFQSWLLVEWL